MAGSKERYQALTAYRTQFLQRARHNASLTIPSLVPLEGQDAQAHLVEPYQSDGANNLISLASRITMALLPAGRPYLRLDIPPKEVMSMEGDVPPEVQAELAKGETLIQAAVERANWRSATMQEVQQLIVAGSVTEEYMDDNTIRIHRLDRFVWRRDERGRMLECLLLEKWDREALPDGVPVPVDSTGALEDDVEIYTKIHRRQDDTYTVTKETGDGHSVSTVEFRARDLPYLFLRWSATPGEDYGRSKVEETIADLRSLEGYVAASRQLGAMAAMNFVMIRPSASSNGLRNRLSRIENGDVVVGDPETVELKQFANTQGAQIVAANVQELRQSLGKAYLSQGAGQRDAERVTAAEIQRDINEIEAVAGGPFSALSLEMLEVRTHLLMQQMIAAGEFPPVEEDALMPTILTGLEALSRERDVNRVMQAGQLIGAFGEEGIRQVKIPVLLGAGLVGLGFPNAIRPAKEVAAEKQQEQEQAMAQRAAPAAINAASKAQEQQQPQPEG